MEEIRQALSELRNAHKGLAIHCDECDQNLIRTIQAYANKCVMAELEGLADLARQAEAAGFKLRAEAIEARIETLSSSVALSPPGHTEGESGSSKPLGEWRSR